jgi:hypothetical protein
MGEIMSKKYWLILCLVIAFLFTGLGYWLRKPLPAEGIGNNWQFAETVLPGSTKWVDRWKIKKVEKVIVMPGDSVTVTKMPDSYAYKAQLKNLWTYEDKNVLDKNPGTLTITDKFRDGLCPPKPRLTFNGFAVEAGAGLVGLGTTPMIGYEAAVVYKPVTLNIKGDVSASVYIRAAGQMSGADRQVDGSLTAGLQVQF